MKIAQRLTYSSWREEALFEEVLSFLKKHRDAVDEITLFSEDTHAISSQKLEVLRQEIELTRGRIRAFHDAGFRSVGINVLVNIGHIDESSHECDVNLQKIVGYRGDVSTCCCCPNNEELLSFISEKYRLIAETGPDFIWVDDDIKLFWNGVRFGCFCPTCMHKFNAKYGYTYTRETLVAAMEEPGNTSLRSQWVQDISSRITHLLERISQAVREVDPGIRLGFMTQRQSWSTYNGMDFNLWFNALGAEMGRPGEGFYFDTVPEDVIVKALSTAQQAFAYPESVTDIQYELENFPGNLWQKSRRICCAEMALAAAQGMNGVLLNTCHTRECFNGQDALYDQIAHDRIRWGDYLSAGEGWKTGGFYPAFSIHYDQRRTLAEGETFFDTLESKARHDVTGTYALAKLGVPLTMQQAGAWGVILTGNLSQGYTDEELIAFFRGAVIVNGDAVAELERRGMGRYLGVHCIGAGGIGLYEECRTEDPINVKLGRMPVRDVRPAFFGGEGVYLEATDPRVRVISDIRDHGGDTLGIGTALYENELGGRVCVMGYAPFKMPNDILRFAQLSEICAWLVPERQSAKLVTPGKTILFVREGETGTATGVMNLMLDTQNDVELAIRGARTAELCTAEGRKPLAVRQESGWGFVTLEELVPFAVQFIVAGR